MRELYIVLSDEDNAKLEAKADEAGITNDLEKVRDNE